MLEKPTRCTWAFCWIFLHIMMDSSENIKFANAPNRQNKYYQKSVKSCWFFLHIFITMYGSENVKFTQVGLNVLITGTKRSTESLNFSQRWCR